MSDCPIAAPAGSGADLGAPSTVSREIIAGCTTFGAMSYIVVVNPQILSAIGAGVHDLITVTALAAMIGTLIMALMVRLPIALAPGMGSNVVFAQVAVVRLGLSYGTALTMVLIGGLLFVLLSLTRFREHLVQGFPSAIRIGLQCGIGLFIAYSGCATAASSPAARTAGCRSAGCATRRCCWCSAPSC